MKCVLGAEMHRQQHTNTKKLHNGCRHRRAARGGSPVGQADVARTVAVDRVLDEDVSGHRSRAAAGWGWCEGAGPCSFFPRWAL